MKLGRKQKTTYFVTRKNSSGELVTHFGIKTLRKAKRLFNKDGLGVWRETQTTFGSISERILRNA